ncbi:MAG: hypothetical protein ACK4S4_09350 [Pyrinomonadaceae bacterium]
MSEETIRLYSVAMMAFSAEHSAAADGGIYVEQLAALVPALSIADAAEMVKQCAFEKWPTVEGWHGHRAVISMPHRNFHTFAARAYVLGKIEMDPVDPETTFIFDDEPAAVSGVDLQDIEWPEIVD